MSRGPIPYGQVSYEEKLAISTMHRLSRGGESLRSICDVLNRMSVKSPRGKRWHPATLARVMRENGIVR